MAGHAVDGVQQARQRDTRPLFWVVVLLQRLRQVADLPVVRRRRGGVAVGGGGGVVVVVTPGGSARLRMPRVAAAACFVLACGLYRRRAPEPGCVDVYVFRS